MTGEIIGAPRYPPILRIEPQKIDIFRLGWTDFAGAFIGLLSHCCPSSKPLWNRGTARGLGRQGPVCGEAGVRIAKNS